MAKQFKVAYNVIMLTQFLLFCSYLTFQLKKRKYSLVFGGEIYVHLISLKGERMKNICKSLDDQTQVDSKPAGQPEHASLNQCQLIAP